MQFTTTPRVCAFCGKEGDQDTCYAAGFGVLMCTECLRYFNETVPGDSSGHISRDSTGWVIPSARRSVADLTDEELLETLPRIAGSAQQANRFMADWVEQIRERRLSWTTIGTAMGISRQAAWERFTRVLGTDRNPAPR